MVFRSEQGERLSRMQCMLKCVGLFRTSGSYHIFFYHRGFNPFLWRTSAIPNDREQLLTTSRASLCYTVHTPPASKNGINDQPAFFSGIAFCS
jgi:hypothetical protein